MPDNAYNDLSYSAKKTIQTSSFVLFFIPSKKVIQDSISVFSFPTTLKMKLQVLVSFQFRFPTTLDKITLTSTVMGNGNRIEWSPIRSVIIRVITKSDDLAAGVRFVCHEYDYRPNWTTRSLITN